MSENMYIPAKFVSVAKAERKGYKGVELVYVTNKTGTKITDFVFTSTLKAKPTLLDILKGLKEGQEIKVHKEKNGKNSKLVAIYTDVDEKKSSSRSKGASSSGTTDFNTRASRGQALNLAVSVAVAEGKQHEDGFILKQVARFIELGQKVQDGELEATEAESTDELESLGDEEEVETAADDLSDLL